MKQRERRMWTVYEPENIIDAHLVKGVLEQCGLPVYLRGEHLMGGIGELPVSGLLALCVPEIHEAQARDVLAELARNRALATSEQDEDGEWAGVLA